EGNVENIAEDNVENIDVDFGDEIEYFMYDENASIEYLPFHEDWIVDDTILQKTRNILNERSFCTHLELLGSLEPKYLIQQLLGFIEFIQNFPDPGLDAMKKFVLQYLHLCVTMNSGNKVAKKYLRFFESYVRDKNYKRKILNCTKGDAIRFFRNEKFKVELSKETFLAVKKKLETEERVDILHFINLFFDIVGRIDEDKECEMKKPKIVLRLEIDAELRNIFEEFFQNKTHAVTNWGYSTTIGIEDFKKLLHNLIPKISSCKPKENGVETRSKYKKVFQLFLEYYCLSVEAGCYRSECEKKKFINLFCSFLKKFNSFFNINEAEEETFATTFSFFMEQNSFIMGERDYDENCKHLFTSLLRENVMSFDGSGLDIRKFPDFYNSFYERSDPFVKDLQRGNSSFTTVFPSQPSSSKAKENIKKGSAPIRQAENTDVSSPSSLQSSQHEANQTVPITTEHFQEMSLSKIKKYFSKNLCKYKELHLISIPKEDIVSAADATNLYVVCGFVSSLIRFWNISDQWLSPLLFDEHCILRGHKGIVNSVEINSELRRLISGSCDETVRIWDLEMRTCLSVHIWHSGAVYSVCWSPAYECVLSSSADSTAVLYWYETESTKVYTHKTDIPIYVVRFHPNGLYFATAATDGTIALWTIEDNRSSLRWFANDDGVKVNTISFSPCGQFLAAGDKTGWIYVWGISENELVKHFNANGHGIKHLTYNKGGDAIAATFFDETWCIFYPLSKKGKIYFQRSTGTTAWSVHFIKDDTLLVIEN
ncbi:WD_REPEATS_REGION domain-containing protein, partial [Trichonephila inaurata madagascariensis]